MPEISRFFGIVVTINYNDHSPPHFHAQHGDEELIVRIKDLSIVRGKFSPKDSNLLMEWAAIHQEELLRAWEDAQNHQKPRKIAPLA